MLAQRLHQSGKPVVVHDGLACRRGIEINGVDHALEPGVLAGDRPDGVSERFAKAGGLQCDGWPATFGWKVEPDESVVLVDDLPGGVEVPDFVCDSLNLVVEDVRESLEKYQREDVILELGGVERAANLAGRIPQPGLKRLDVKLPGMPSLVCVELPSRHRRRVCDSSSSLRNG